MKQAGQNNDETPIFQFLLNNISVPPKDNRRSQILPDAIE